MKKIRSQVFFTLLVIISICGIIGSSKLDVFATSSVNPENQEDNYIAKDVVRVGWYEEPGKQFYTSKGLYTGYLYEYFKAMSKYGNFELKFIPGTRNECLARLKNGSIDVLAAVQDSDINSDYYLSTDTTIGMNNVILYSRNDDKEIVPQDYITYNEKRIAVIQGNDVISDFENFMSVKGFDCIFVEYEDYESLLEKKDDNKYDMILTNGSIGTNFTKFSEIDRFSSSPIYLSVSKTNKILLNKINRAMYDVSIYEPELIDLLSEKYFTSSSSLEMKLTNGEISYLAGLGTVKFGVVLGNGYMAYDDEREIKGIQPQYIALMCQKLDISYEIISYTSYLELYKALYNGEIDIIPSFPYDYTVANLYDSVITPSYYENSYYLIRRVGDNDDQDNWTYATVDYAVLQETNPIFEQYPYSKVLYYDNYEDCLNAVANGDANYTICSAIVADYYLSGEFSNSLERSLTDNSIGQSFGGTFENMMLVTILGRAIGSMSDEDRALIQNSVIGNESRSLSAKEWIYRYPYQALGIVLMFLVLLIVMSMILYYNSVTIKKNKKIEDALAASMHDSMTGLYNHLAIKNELSYYFKNRKQSEVAWFIMMDIDTFKTINDTYGHHEGDKVLIRFAQLLRSVFSDSCLISRMGGDEFSVFIKKECGEEEVRRLLTTFQQMLASSKHQKLEGIEVTASIGYARVPLDGEDFQTIYQKADEAMYRAKNNGKNQYSS